MGQNSPWFPLHFLWKEREQCKRIGWFYPMITDKASCFSVFLRLRKTQSLPSVHEVGELDGWGPRTLSVCPPPGIGHRRLLERVRLEAALGKPREHILSSLCHRPVSGEAVRGDSMRLTAQDDSWGHEATEQGQTQDS